MTITALLIFLFIPTGAVGFKQFDELILRTATVNDQAWLAAREA